MGQYIEPCQSHARAEEIDEGDQPTDLQEVWVFFGWLKDQEDHHHGWRDAKGDDIGYGVEFLAKERFTSTESGDTSIEGVTDHREEDEPNRLTTVSSVL